MQELGTINIIAHRAGNSVENLIAAVKDGATMVETDVHLTRDGILIAQYPAYIERKNGQRLYFCDHDYCEFNKNSITLLKDILLLAHRLNVKVLLDIKKGRIFYCEIGKRIAELVNSLNLTDTVEAISFDHKCIQEIRKYSQMRVGIMYVARLFCLREILNIYNIHFIEICGDYLDDEDVSVAQSANVDVYGWGTDDAEVLKYYKMLGLKAVTVNDVKAAKKILR